MPGKWREHSSEVVLVSIVTVDDSSRKSFAVILTRYLPGSKGIMNWPVSSETVVGPDARPSRIAMTCAPTINPPEGSNTLPCSDDAVELCACESKTNVRVSSVASRPRIGNARSRCTAPFLSIPDVPPEMVLFNFRECGSRGSVDGRCRGSYNEHRVGWDRIDSATRPRGCAEATARPLSRFNPTKQGDYVRGEW